MSSFVLPNLFLLMPLALVGGLVIAAMRWDRYRRTAGSSRLAPTSEAFIDPETGRRVRVWADPMTGERAYREE